MIAALFMQGAIVMKNLDYKELPNKKEIRFAVLKTLSYVGKIEKSRESLPKLLKQHFKLSDGLTNLRTKRNGANYWKMSIAFELTALKMAGLIEYPTRGSAAITQLGKDFLESHKSEIISDDDLMKFPSFVKYVERSRNGRLPKKEQIKLQNVNIDTSHLTMQNLASIFNHLTNGKELIISIRIE